METRATLDWCRRVSDATGTPLATVLTWPRPVLHEAIGVVLVDAAAQVARAVAAQEREAPAGDDTFARAVRAIADELAAQALARKRAENDRAFAELIAQGAFGGQP